MISLGLTSVEFLCLLPIVALFYYIVPRRFRRYYLLLINVIFYTSFGYTYIPLLVVEALIIWIAGIEIAKNRNNKTIKFITVTSVFVLFLILLYFKAGSNFTESIVAPLGISFYTLQAISYIEDIRARKIIPERNFVKLLVYLSFFPTITSGPIYRYDDFTEQYDHNIELLRADYDRITNGIIYMIYGYFLKLVIAERAAIPVNKVFSDFESAEYGGIILFVIAVTYSLQIYADFAGYSAIVIGIAQIFGYDIPENFIAPYLSQNIKEFWGRWHISLSIWLRDYIYIPLGGNRKGRLRKHINIMITFLVSGLWHGFRWHFLVWGFMHGAYQIIDECTIGARKRILSRLGLHTDLTSYKIFQRIITFILVTIAWIFFHTGFKESLRYIIMMVTSLNIGGIISGRLWELGLPPFGWIMLIMGSIFIFMWDYLLYIKNKRIDTVLNEQGFLVKDIMIIVMSLTILILGIYGDLHDPSYFVYRDF